MKMKSDKDSTGFKKVSIIDNFALQMSYNMARRNPGVTWAWISV